MGSTTQHPSLCRLCHAACPVVVDIEDGVVLRVRGNRESPAYHGYCCSRGQAAPEHIRNPDRLLHSMKRQPDGSYRPIAIDQAMDEIAGRLSAIIDEHGANSLAAYFGTYSAPYPGANILGGGWVTMLGSQMIFSSGTIDQPGKDIANAMLGRWRAGPHAFDESDVWMTCGGNPIVTHVGGIPSPNPARRLKQQLDAGMQLIVIDPRRCETAARAHIHLQARPGEDASLLAAMLHVIIEEGLYDRAFVDEYVEGLERLRREVEPFTTAFAAARADVPEPQIAEAARVFAAARRGLAVGGTGANMSGHSTLVEYLLLCLNTICGRFVREGESVANPGVLQPRAIPRAQAVGPRPYEKLGVKLSARGLEESACGLPTAALADQILHPGPERVRALFSMGGNPAAAWPDQKRAAAALESLELCVQVDIKMSATAKMADYVIAPKVSFEVPGFSYALESLESFSVLWGMAEPFGMYAPALVDPPAGSDLIEEWEFFYGLAQRMGVPLFTARMPSLTATDREGAEPQAVDMKVKPTTEQLFELLVHGSRISLEEVKRHPNGALFPESIRALPREVAAAERLCVGNAAMLAELAEVFEEAPIALAENREYPFQLVCRRQQNVYNSSLRDIEQLARRNGNFNPAFMQPDDLRELALEAGDAVEIRSAHGSIPAVVEPDATLRRGLVSMAHAFGGAPGEKSDFRQEGSNTSVLVSVEDGYDRISGIPRMSAIPVNVRLLLE
ncbi:MAG: molybdopterin-dependent oxidoreductase [Deltaproteobacteria bacterium]|nr:molybdopterin-dependent oxidoreductase [Deltaproteobacteria bacterium]